ncbi:MAG: hypothetical protein U9Q33_04890 [Campylobacterota bacterium]|nr:hypothetical protein [Campylobacterota bacterium]
MTNILTQYKNFPKSKFIELLFMTNDYNNILNMFKQFENSMYIQASHTVNLKTLTFQEEVTLSGLIDKCGKTELFIENELSDMFELTDAKIDYNNYKYFPFELIKLDLPQDMIGQSVYIYNNKNEIFFHFTNIESKYNMQCKFSNKGLYFQNSYSSMYFNNEIEKISEKVKSKILIALTYTLSAMLYLINFENDNAKVKKDMKREEYQSKYTQKQLSKPKIAKKLNTKKNTIKLTLDKPCEQSNNITFRTNNKINKKFLVRGHWRNQRYVSNGIVSYKQIWIKHFYKGIDNKNFQSKSYKLSA